MIHYNSLWETMSNKHFTTYTLNKLCEILNCRLDEVAEYVPDDVD